MNTLSNEQKNIINHFKNNENIFMTGSGGTGKSYLIRILKSLSIQYGKKCAVTAMTGKASLQLECDAKTIHSWSGLGAVDEDKEKPYSYYFHKLIKNEEMQWITVDILIIDEVSMMSKYFFNLLDYVAKQLRNNPKPFGGIQVIFSGDFYQLPPVKGEHCFKSELWEKTFPKIHILKTIFRQKDNTFQKILNRIRVGDITRNGYEILKSRIVNEKELKKLLKREIIPTIFFPTNEKVNDFNEKFHDKLSDINSKTFYIDVIRPTKKMMETNELCDEEIENRIELFKKENPSIHLKIGDQVICNHNIDNNIVNGSSGIIVNINDYPIVKFTNGIRKTMEPIILPDEEISCLFYKKVPLQYGWALSIHKSQGLSVDECLVDVGHSLFAPGQMYVALSRVKTIEGLYIKDFDINKICLVDNDVKEFYKKSKKHKIDVSNDIIDYNISTKYNKYKSYYNILGFTEEVSDEEVKKKFKKLSLIHHPDKGGDEERFKLILCAYKTICDN